MWQQWYEALTSLRRDTVSVNVHSKEPRRNVDDREREDISDEKAFGGSASSVRELERSRVTVAKTSCLYRDLHKIRYTASLRCI